MIGKNISTLIKFGVDVFIIMKLLTKAILDIIKNYLVVPQSI